MILLRKYVYIIFFVSFIESIDFEMASERVMAGIEKKTMMSPEEKRVVAVHGIIQ